MSVRVAVAGASGRMGRELLSAAADRDDVEVVLAVNRDPSVEAVAGVDVDPAADLAAGLREREPQVLVEFTGPDSTVAYAADCAEAGVAFVSGTTGLSGRQRRRVREAGEEVPVLRASNFSRGIGVLESLLREAVDRLPEYDVELVEAHHAGKRDAPSGTASDLVDAVEDVRDGGNGDPGVHGREGESLRSPGEVGVHSVRAGSIPGEHELLLAGEGEQLRIEHRAGDRRCFAVGALEAAVELADRSPGVYDLREVRG